MLSVSSVSRSRSLALTARLCCLSVCHHNTVQTTISTTMLRYCTRCSQSLPDDERLRLGRQRRDARELGERASRAVRHRTHHAHVQVHEPGLLAAVGHELGRLARPDLDVEVSGLDGDFLRMLVANHELALVT